MAIIPTSETAGGEPHFGELEIDLEDAGEIGRLPQR